MRKKLVRIQFLYENVKGGAEKIAQHIIQQRKNDHNIIFYFKGFSFYLFSSAKQRKINRKKIFLILIFYKYSFSFISHFYQNHIIALLLSLLVTKRINLAFLVHSGIYRNTFSKLYFIYIIILGFILRLFLKLRKNSRIIYTSKYSRKSHINHLWPKSEVLYFDIPLNNQLSFFIQKNLEESINIRIGFVGRYHIDKGIELLIKILQEFDFKNNPKFKFDVLIPDLPSKNNITNHPMINIVNKTDNIYSFLSKIDILLIPSKNESYPIILLEAINAGCQIIAANVGGISENKSNLIKLLNNDDYKEWIKEILISKPLTLNSRKKLIYFSKDQANLDYYISRIEKNVGK